MYCTPSKTAVTRLPHWFRCWQIEIAMTLGFWGVIIVSGTAAFAQIVPDSTLGLESSAVTPNVPVGGQTAERIIGGAVRGTNLFHSFLEFNIGNGQRVYFANPAGVENILSRVTGFNPSNIQGTLGVEGTANLFLLNPNGIIFGQNARLDVQGSFIGSTANSINLADETQFSTTPSQTVPLLTIAVPLGLQFGTNSGSIRVEGPGRQGVAQGLGLKVPQGKTFALVGGNVNLEGGILQAPGGRIELGGLGAAGTVQLTGNNFSLSFPAGVTRSDVTLNSQAVVDVTADNLGDIAINARNVDILGSSICAGIGASPTCGATSNSAVGTAASQAGNILIGATGTVRISQSSRVENDLNLNATGNSANIFNAVQNNILFGSIIIGAESFELTENAQVSTSTFGNGSAGVVFVETTGDVLIENSEMSSRVEPKAVGDAGGILIEAGSLSLSNSVLNSSTFGNGNAGLVSVETTGSVFLENSGISSAVEVDTQGNKAVGDAGGILIEAGSISLTNASALTTQTFGTGSGGIVLLKADGDISLSGSGTLIASNVEANATGETIGIRIEGESLSMSEGANIQALTRGNGNAGIIEIETRDFVDLSGVSPDGFSTGLFTSTEDNATGPGGFIQINTDTLRLSDAAVLSARTRNAFAGGDILVTANRVELLNGGQILTTAFNTGEAGRILIIAPDSIILSGRDSTFNERFQQTLAQYITQFGPEQGLIIALQIFDNVAPGSSGLFANTSAGSNATGGGLAILTRDLIVENEAKISVNNQGSGTAGNLFIQARSIQLSDRGTITAETASGQGGNIALEVEGFILLRRNSEISTTAGTAQSGGNGGNIDIDTQFIVGYPINDNNIRANAYTGKGGNVNIVGRPGLFDIDKREAGFLTSNDITASSEFGIDGTIALDPLETDVSRGLAPLPSNLIDPTQLIDRRCTANTDSAERSSFTVTGRGGLPPNPADDLEDNTGVSNWVSAEEGEPAQDLTSNPQFPVPSPQSPITEAQGWMMNENGQVVLTAQAPTVTPQGTWQTSAECR